MPVVGISSTEMKLICNDRHPPVFHIPQLQNISVYGIIELLKKDANLIAQVTVLPFRFGILLLGFHQSDNSVLMGGDVALS